VSIQVLITFPNVSIDKIVVDIQNRMVLCHGNCRFVSEWTLVDGLKNY